MILLAVNYHYFCPERRPRGRAIFPTAVPDFEAQLGLLGRGFEFVGRDALLAAASGDGDLPERGCVITFDDGLRSQLELALPVLERLGVPGIFFIAGRPLAERRPLFVHQVHHLRETLSDEEFLEALAGALPKVAAMAEAVREQAIEAYRYDSPAAACTKYILNFALEREERELAIERLFTGLEGDGERFARELYMSAEQVGALEAAHGAVGAHSFAHQPLGLLEPGDLREELERSAAALERATGRRPRAISYPYGGAEAVTRAVADAARQVGFGVGFTMERAFNDSLEDPLLLARIDTNDAPGGRRPLFTVREGELELEPAMGAAPARYPRPASLASARSQSAGVSRLIDSSSPRTSGRQSEP